jgi:cysteinyl-tRNA synthetase
MALRLYNTLTRQKDLFTPIDPANVRMYVCGPTVYDFAHIGNGRALIVFDVVYRLLRHLYGPEHVTYVRNVTDVDDKINARAAEDFPGVPLNEAIRRVTETTERQYHEDALSLGCLPPTLEPRATENIGAMIKMIEELIRSGNAYEAEGHVLFHVASMPDYGKFANRSLDEMMAGARIEVAPYKRDPMDFVLWKPSKPGEPAWPSPWGMGRPGWHIECSAMAGEFLGPIFDIHGGGIDLVFPHHENEIAQSRAANHTHAMANYWMHNGFLQAEGEKMSKSLGNFATIRQFFDGGWQGRLWSTDAIRFTMLGTHYRQPLDWTLRAVETAEAVLDDFFLFAGQDGAPRLSPAVLEALEDDVNTPKAITELHAIRNRIRHAGEGEAAVELADNLAFFGLNKSRYDAFVARERSRVLQSQDRIDELIAARIVARKARNFAEADRLRNELEAMGIILMDGKDPATGELVTTWEVKR